MSEKDNLQEADGNKELETIEIQDSNSETEVSESVEDSVDETVNDSIIEETKTEVTEETKTEATEETKTESTEETNAEKEADLIEKKADAHVEEIEESNAEDAEDENNSERHTLETKDYHAMSMDELVLEFDKLLKHHKIQTIKSHIDEIKLEFNSKFNELHEQKKEEFVHDGGNELDFYYTTPLKKDFNSLFKDYKSALNAYYKNLESNLKSNLETRLRIIEDIKGLINVEENINTTYKHFKELQEEWRNAGPIPRDKYNTAWNTYHHHVEIFYDFLHLNRDLRDMDFKHNYEQKLKIIERAEDLAKDDNTNRTFRELQVLHKMWKEDLGPVAKEHREEIWQRFSTATKTIHDKRQAFYADLDKAYETNLIRKEEIISKIDEVVNDNGNSHQSWQKKIKIIEALRDDFFNAGKVSIKVNEATWSKFKGSVRAFNKKKNAFYKSLKKDQYDNLQKKLDLIKIAEDNKENTDFETVTPLMKKIQSEWKKIGHVPRKDSDKIWHQFKSACNQYFDKLHASRNAANKEQFEAFDKKIKLLDGLKTLELEGKPKSDIELIKSKIKDWKDIGAVPQNKRYIEGKFNKALDELFNKLKMDKTEVEMIKFENKLENLAKPNDSRLLDNEHNFIRKKIDELKGEINQLENNLQFFSNVNEDNPLVKEVLGNIDKHKENLGIWEEKYKKIKGMY